MSGALLPYQKLFSRVLRINPEAQKLQDICRILLERELPCTSELIDMAFKWEDQSNSKTSTNSVQTERKGNREIDELSIGSMSNITEFPKIIKKEFLMPESIFDRRLTRLELMVKKKQYRETRRSWDQMFQEQNQLTSKKIGARQKTYLLMDVSASTQQHHRLVIEKAIAIAYLESNNKQMGEIYFRAFNQQPGSLKVCKSISDYRKLINSDIMTAQALGQTNLQLALETALDDLKQQASEHPAEILVLTDGLSPIDVEDLLQQKIPCKVHIVLIGGDIPILDERDLQERFNRNHQGHLEEIKNAVDLNKKQRTQTQLHELFLRKKEQLKTEILDDLRSHLRQLCHKTHGLFLHIPDLPDALTCHQNQVEAIHLRVDEIQKKLIDPQTTALEKEQLLDELLALRAYLEELRNNNADAKIKEEFKQLQARIGKITLSTTELQAMLEHLQLTYRWRSQGNSGPSIPFLKIMIALWKNLKKRWFKPQTFQ